MSTAQTFRVPVNPHDSQFYHIFVHEVVPVLSESLDAVFWRTEILRNCDTRPAVQHAAVALGAMYRQLLTAQNTPAQTASTSHDPKLELASSFRYTAAIQSLQVRVSQLSRSSELIEEALMACLLFVCIELLRGDDIAAATHLQGAIAVYRSQCSARDTATTHQKARNSFATASAFPAIAKIFVRLEYQAVSYVGSLTPELLTKPTIESPSIRNIPTSFETLLEARDTLYFHLMAILQFITPPYGAEKCFPGWTPHPDRGLDTYTILHGSTYRDYHLPQAGSQRRHFMQILSGWKSAFQGFLQKGTVKLPEELAECASLWAAFHTTRIKLIVAFSDHECLYDEQVCQFEKIVEQAEKYRNYTVGITPVLVHPNSIENDVRDNMRKIRPKQRDTLSLKMGVNHAVYFTALKCRYKPIRQQALALLQGNGTKGIWDGQMLSKIAEYVIAVEESSTSLIKSTEGGDNFGVSEANRIHCLSLNIDKCSKMIWMQYNRRDVTLDGSLSRSTDLKKRWRIANTKLNWNA